MYLCMYVCIYFIMHAFRIYIVFEDIHIIFKFHKHPTISHRRELCTIFCIMCMFLGYPCHDTCHNSVGNCMNIIGLLPGLLFMQPHTGYCYAINVSKWKLFGSV